MDLPIPPFVGNIINSILGGGAPPTAQQTPTPAPAPAASATCNCSYSFAQVLRMLYLSLRCNR